MIIVAGDWNQWSTNHVLQEHPDMAEVEHGPTRKDWKIDKFLVNFNRSAVESDTLPPLDDGMGRASDHLISYFKAAVRKQAHNKITFSYRHFTEEGALKFENWLAAADFSSILSSSDTNEQLDSLLCTLEEATNVFFP